MASQTLLDSRTPAQRHRDVRLAFEQAASTGEEVRAALQALVTSARAPQMAELFRSGPAAAQICRPSDA